MSFFLSPSGWIIKPLFSTEFLHWAILISASFLHWIYSISYPYSSTLYILNSSLIKQLFPDPRRRCPRFEFPASTGAGPRQLRTLLEPSQTSASVDPLRTLLLKTLKMTSLSPSHLSSRASSEKPWRAPCRGPAPVDPGNSKWGQRRQGSGNNCLIKH